MKKDKKTHEEVFSKIYNNYKWGKSKDFPFFSGGGSIISNAKHWLEFVPDYVQKKNVKSVVDAGCGDLTISKHLIGLFKERDLKIEYTGYDCFKDIVSIHNKNNPELDIRHLDIHANKQLLKPADCILFKEVMQHWETCNIFDVFNYLIDSKKYKYIITQNSCPNEKKDWLDCDHSSDRTGRGLHSELEPMKTFDFKSEIIYETYNPNGEPRTHEICTLTIDS